MEIKTSEEISRKYQELTRITPTDERYIWRTQTKWIKIEDVIKLINNFQKELLEIVDDCISDWSYIESEYNKKFEELKKDLGEE